METYATYAAQLAPQGLPMFGHKIYPLPVVSKFCGYGFEQEDTPPKVALNKRIDLYRPVMIGKGWKTSGQIAEDMRSGRSNNCVRSALLKLIETNHVVREEHDGLMRYKWIGD